ncbi:hypothetical protein D3C87_1017540 [compost metagenome]
MTVKKVTKSDILEMAMKLRQHDEMGGHPRDIESDIFQRPKTLNADFEGDMIYQVPTPKNRTVRVVMRRKFNNMSMQKKNLVRKIQKKLSHASKSSAMQMIRNMKKLHDK